jgi:Glycosyl transferase family 90
MPGILFHHETETKDWFYDLMQPWVHFIPVAADLSDLRSRYDWAEAHPEEVKAMAEASTQLADSMFRPDYLNQIYQELFVDYFGKVVQAYQPSGLSWEECEAQYSRKGIPIYEVSVCNHENCNTQWDVGRKSDGYKVI